MNNAEPIFKSVFAEQWDKLPAVLKLRYANHPFSNEVNRFEGHMDIHYSKFMSNLLPLFKLFKVMVPYQGSNVPVKVNLRSKPDSAAFYFERTFYFPRKKPFEFFSAMKVVQQNEVIDEMGYGIGWRMRYFYDGTKVVMQHKGYVLELFGMRIPLPLEWLMGKGHAEEIPIDDNSYHLNITMTHPLFGQLYQYSGNFTYKTVIT